jgi:hypothetical protein
MYRFAMGSPDDPCSATWRIWTQGAEAYLSIRVMTTVAKMSLHSNGYWQFAIDRMASSWRRPVPFRPGWVRGPVVVIPHNDLTRRRPYLDPNPTEKTFWLRQPDFGMAAQIELLFMEPAAAFGTWKPTDDLGTMQLATLRLAHAHRLHVIRRDRPLLPSEIEGIAMRRSILSAKSAPTDPQYGYSGFTVQSHQLGGPLLFETQHEM